MGELFITESDQSLYNMYDLIDNSVGLLESAAAIIKANSDNPSLTEAAVTESAWNQVYESNLASHDYAEDIINVTPFFTPDEYREVNENYDGTDFQYICVADSNKYYRAVKKLQEQLDATGESHYVDQLLELGWNPWVPINKMTVKYAREKQIRWLNEHKQIRFIDLTKVKTDYYTTLNEAGSNSLFEPIYIVLSYTGTAFGKVINWWKKSQYSHAALSLDASLKKLWSYNRTFDGKVDGLSIESIDDYKNKHDNDNANLYVMAVFVPKHVKEKIEETLEWYRINAKNTKYSIKNIAMIAFNKTQDTLYSMNMVCSQFVDNILKIANVDITHKANNLVAPQDFVRTVSEENRVYALYEGLKSNYNPKEVENKVKAILNTLGPKFKKAAKAIRASMAVPAIESFNASCEDNAEIDSILSTIQRDFLKPTSIIEAARIPVGFNKKGDLYIDTPKDLEAEYQEAHKLLSIYDENNLQGIKHELARLFYVGSIIERRCRKLNRNSQDYKDLIKLKARVMNDFTKYMALVMASDKNFDFSEYMKHTEYYNKTVIIGNDTLRYSGQFIKKAFKLFV